MSWLGRHKDQIRSAIIGLVVIGVTICSVSVVYLYRQRKAIEAEIAINIQASEEAEAAASKAAEEIKWKTFLEDFRLDHENVEWQGKTYKRNRYIKAILCMGIDRSDVMTETKVLGEAGQADGIFLLAHDTARNELKILSIPRDTITEITTTNTEGEITGTALDHLTLAFGYGDGKEKSGHFMVEAVSELFRGLTIDHYFASDLGVIGDLNDAVGGVTVTVPEFGMENADPVFVSGEQVLLKGKMAEQFVRYRDINRDQSAIYRMNQQKEYITQYFQMLKKASKEDSRIVEKLFEIMEDYMVTDMDKGEYMKLVVDVLASDGIQNENFRMLPGNGISGEEYDEFYPNTEEMISLILELFYREVN